MMGRPTKYDETIIPKTIDYMNNYDDYHDVFPSVEGLAVALGVGRTTVYRWEDEKEDFRNTLDALRTQGIRVLFNKGLKNEANAMMCKLALGNHGITEKVQTDLISSDDSLVPSVIKLVPAEFPENFLEDAEYADTTRG